MKNPEVKSQTEAAEIAERGQHVTNYPVNDPSSPYHGRHFNGYFVPNGKDANGKPKGNYYPYEWTD